MNSQTKMPQIFNVFSKREPVIERPSRPLTSEFKYRVLQLCVDTFDHYKSFYEPSSHSQFWRGIQNKLQYLHGHAIPSPTETSIYTNTAAFLLNCSDEHFLDFVEMMFQSPLIWVSHEAKDPDELVDDINQFLVIDDLPYHLTDFVLPTFARRTNSGSFLTRPLISNGPPNVQKYPQIIRRDSDVLHSTAIHPTLALLRQPGFELANKEFLDALGDFRKHDYADCVAKCGSSLESVMKIICDLKGWAYNEHDTASALLNNIRPRTTLEPFFDQPIILIATIRNRLSSAHGAGTQSRAVSKPIANYVINSTAATILLLVEVTNA